MGGALKNVLAIACGISDGLGFGNNGRAALITRGLAEMTRLVSTSTCPLDTHSGSIINCLAELVYAVTITSLWCSCLM